MSEEDIIRMAWEAGFAIVDKHILADNENGPEHVICTEAINRFAAIVVAAERNSWPAEMEAMERQVNILTDALTQAKAEEREACAKVCEAEGLLWGQRYAAAIRARGETK